MSVYPCYQISYNDFNDFQKIEILAKKLHCALKWSGSQLVTVRKFNYWLMKYKKELSINENDINCIIPENTPYGWSSVTNYCIQNLLFYPIGVGNVECETLFHEDFIVFRKATIYDFKFDPDCCTAAIDKYEAKEIIRLGIDRYNKIYRPEILKIQKTYYSNDTDLVSSWNLNVMSFENCLIDQSLDMLTLNAGKKPLQFAFGENDTSSPIDSIILSNELYGDTITYSSLEKVNDMESNENLVESKDRKISPCNFREVLLKMSFMYEEFELNDEEEEEFNDDEFSQKDVDEFLLLYQRLLDVQQRYFKLTMQTLLS